jgi:hypothetical protein
LIIPQKVENNANNDLNYIIQKPDGTIGISFQPFRKLVFSSSNYNPHIRNISLPRYNLSQLKTNLDRISKGKMIDTPYYSVKLNTNLPSSPTQFTNGITSHRRPSNMYGCMRI